MQEEQEGGQTFLSGVRHAGWLWRRFGRGHKATWKKLWVRDKRWAMQGGVSASMCMLAMLPNPC